MPQKSYRSEVDTTSVKQSGRSDERFFHCRCYGYRYHHCPQILESYLATEPFSIWSSALGWEGIRIKDPWYSTSRFRKWKKRLRHFPPRTQELEPRCQWRDSWTVAVGSRKSRLHLPQQCAHFWFGEIWSWYTSIGRSLSANLAAESVRYNHATGQWHRRAAVQM